MLRPVFLGLGLGLGLGLCSLLLGQAEAPSPVEPPERSRPYAVLRGQNLGLSLSVTFGASSTTLPAVTPPHRHHHHITVFFMAYQVLMGTIFSILLVTVILMAFCVYKPIRRR
ncbi:putative uncharacterized protein C12orf76-like protein [Sciurus carolinensis]|uniref:Uncharacterized protein n=1 Tax=Sciurus carolinensis TaxID=30640 RepID=A0AA41T1E3_SCICA|nr:putative uncharacterized protein C12orf76-like protein [Sciurus carolinensis]